jgi:adenylate kinase
MATAKSGASAKAEVEKKIGKLDLGKYLEEIKIGDLSLEDVLEGGSKNLEAIASANRAMIEGYTDLAKRQYEMLKELLKEARKVGGERSEVVDELKGLVSTAKKDVQVLQKMATKVNKEAQQIIKKRTDANIKAWKKVIEDAKNAVSKAPPAKKKAAKKKVVAKKKAARKKVAAKKQ